MRIANELKLTAAAIVCALVTACGGGEATEEPAAQAKQMPQSAQVDFRTASTQEAPPPAYERQTVDLSGRPSWDRGEESCDECVRGAGVMLPATAMPG